MINRLFQANVEGEVLDLAVYCTNATGVSDPSLINTTYNNNVVLLASNASGNSTFYVTYLPDLNNYNNQNMFVKDLTITSNQPYIPFYAAHRYQAVAPFIRQSGGSIGESIFISLSTGGATNGSGCLSAVVDYQGTFTITETVQSASTPYIAINYVDKTQQMSPNSDLSKIFCTSASAGAAVIVNDYNSIAQITLNPTHSSFFGSISSTKINSIVFKDSNHWFLGCNNGNIYEVDVSGNVYSVASCPITMVVGTNPVADPISHLAYSGTNLIVTTTNGMFHIFDYSSVSYSTTLGYGSVSLTSISPSSSIYLGNCYTLNNASTPFWTTPIAQLDNDLVVFSNNNPINTVSSYWLYDTSYDPPYAFAYRLDTQPSYKGFKYDSISKYLYSISASGLCIDYVPCVESSQVPTASQHPTQNYVGARIIRIAYPENGNPILELDQTYSAGITDIEAKYKGCDYYEFSIINSDGDELIDMRKFKA